MAVQDKIVFITGATGDIGYNIASALVKYNNKIIFTGHNKEKLINIKSQLDVINKGNSKEVFIDLSDIKNIKHTFKNILKEYGKIDAFIHCAGLAPFHPVPLIDYNSYINIFNVNYFSFIETAKLFAQQKFSSSQNTGGGEYHSNIFYNNKIA